MYSINLCSFGYSVLVISLTIYFVLKVYCNRIIISPLQDIDVKHDS